MTAEGIPDDPFDAIGGRSSRPRPERLPRRQDDHDRRDDGRRRKAPRAPVRVTRQLHLRPDQGAT